MTYLTVSLIHIELTEPDVFVLQINLTDITKRPLQITARLDTGRGPLISNLKLIGEELWYCHNHGITVYDCQWNKLREIRHGRFARSVAALDTNSVVIATDNGLLISNNSGTCMNGRVFKQLLSYWKKKRIPCNIFGIRNSMLLFRECFILKLSTN